MPFTTEEFQDACRQLDNPDVSEFEFFVEYMDVKIYRKYNEESGLYEYITFGTIDVKPEICHQVYIDLDYRKKWDSYVKALYEVTEGDRKGIYWNCNFPFPMSNRDYIFERESQEFDLDGRHVFVTLGRSAEFSSVPEKSGVIRVDDFKQSLAITANGDTGSKAFMHYYDNPKGMIPTWLINWAAKTGVPGFLQNMTDACKGYPEYLQKKKQKEGR
ncbi:phosphatidylcholine transfer protein-like [Amphiura filiformis]|uniref:phosphatidylcholine transfer protein-like n=1 Tax=Amphiura filiformis TaxID=82378 RepID=UPI003B226DEC